MIIAEALDWAVRRLTDSESPRLDAEVLLAALLGVPRSYLRAWPEAALSATTALRFRTLVAERAHGRPVAHLTGEREFWSLPLRVTPATLIPRPDTELLVELALSCIEGCPAPRLLDLGTGSGAIALALAAERPDARVTAVERDIHACAVARGNARALGLGRVGFLVGDWYAPLARRRFDLIAANPPYIAPEEPELHQGDVRFDPLPALLALDNGLEALRWIAGSAPEHLRRPGWLTLEHGCRQGPAVRELLVGAGFTAVATHTDLQGHERVTLGCLE